MTNRIDTRLAKAAAAGRPALAPFLTIGFPDVQTSTRIAGALLDAGADVLELGVPFSDPLAEGPTIQRSSLHALRQGVTFDTCLDAARDIRRHDDDAALLLMGYYNPLLKYGLADAAGAAADAGCDGFIVPDLPAEECGPFADQCRLRGLHLIPLLAPTSTEERIALACEQAGGFIYCVSVTGVTSARANVHGGTRGLVERIRRHTDLPILVGFGISKPEHVSEVAQFSEGALVGSALIDTIESASGDPAVAAAEFATSLMGNDSPSSSPSTGED